MSILFENLLKKRCSLIEFEYNMQYFFFIIIHLYVILNKNEYTLFCKYQQIILLLLLKLKWKEAKNEDHISDSYVVAFTNKIVVCRFLF